MKYRLFDVVKYDECDPLVPFTLVKEFEEFDSIFSFLRNMDEMLKRQYYFICDESSNPKYFVKLEKDGMCISSAEGIIL